MKQALSRFGWEILEYLRRMVTPFILNVMFGITMLAVLAINIAALEVILIVLLYAGCCLAGFVYMRAAGEAAYKMKLTGEQLRAQNGGAAKAGTASGNGKYRPSKEYRPYKGVVIGLLVSLLPIILIFVGAIADNAGARIAMTFVCGWAYDPVYLVDSLVNGTEQFTNGIMWWGFLLIAVYVALCALGYELGANKERRRQAMLDERSDRIEEQKQAREARIEEQRRRDRAQEESRRTAAGSKGKK